MSGNAQAYTQFAAWLERRHPDVFAQLLANARKVQGIGALVRGTRFSERTRHGFGDYYIDLSSLADAVGPSEYSASDFSIANAVSADTAGAELSPIAGANPSMPSLSTDQIPTFSAPASSSASSVGSFLSSLATPQVVMSALKAATQIITTNATANVIQAQAQRAAAGQAPANVSYIPVTDSTTGIVSPQAVLNTPSGQLPLTGAGINALAPATFLQNYGLYIMLGLAALLVSMES